MAASECIFCKIVAGTAESQEEPTSAAPFRAYANVM